MWFEAMFVMGVNLDKSETILIVRVEGANQLAFC